MAMIITYPSALQFWLHEKGIPYSVRSTSYMEPVSNDVLRKEFFKRKDMHAMLAQLNFEEPVHIAVPDGVRRNNDERFEVHRIPAHLPENSFLRIADSLYIASPELCFLQAALELPLHEAVLLANELCAIYIKDPYTEYGQRRREIITTTESISSFLDAAAGLRGINKAKRAASYALDQSNSPVESRLATFGVLPISGGGAGLLKPELNLDIQLPAAGATHLGSQSICCDMVWPEKKIVLEYDSTLTHLSVYQHFKDKRRFTALTFSGYKTISVTAEQLHSFRAIEELFLNIRHTLGMRTHKKQWDNFFEKRWDVAHCLLIDPMNQNNTKVNR